MEARMQARNLRPLALACLQEVGQFAPDFPGSLPALPPVQGNDKGNGQRPLSTLDPEQQLPQNVVPNSPPEISDDWPGLDFETVDFLTRGFDDFGNSSFGFNGDGFFS
jgi:hypothetical protein